MVGDALTARGLAALLALACAAGGCVTSEVTLPRQGKLGLRVGTSDLLDFNGSLVDAEGNVGPEVLDADGTGGLLVEAEYFVIDQLSVTAAVRSNDIDWTRVGGGSGSGRVDEFALGTRVYLVHPAWRQRVELLAGIDFSGIRVDTGVRDESGVGLALLLGVQGWLTPRLSVETRLRFGFAYTGSGVDELDHEFTQFELAGCWWFGD